MRFILPFLFLTALAPSAAAQSSGDEEWLLYMADVNRGSALESPGSKGSLSLKVGAGIQQQQAPLSNSRLLEQMRPVSASIDSSPALHFVSLQKGTPWPLDFGVSFGQTGVDNDIKRFGANLQWTALEIPRGISFSTRASFFRTQGFSSAAIDSRELAAIIGGGYGYVNAYALGGIVDHLAELDWREKNWRQSIYALGVQARLGTPFITATLEWAYRDKTYRGLAAKLAVGI